MLVISLIQQLKLRQKACAQSTETRALPPILFLNPSIKPPLTNLMTRASHFRLTSL